MSTSPEANARIKKTPSEMDRQVAFCALVTQLGLVAKNNRTATTSDGTWTRPDVLVSESLGATVANVEVKAPEEFRTPAQRAAARKQALKDSSRVGTSLFAWTDGSTFYLEEKMTRRLRVSVLIPTEDLPTDAPDEDLGLRIGFSRSSFERFPAEQRDYAVRGKQAVDVARADPLDHSGFLAGDYDVAMVEGEADSGKSTYLNQLSARNVWDPIQLDAASFAGETPEAVLRRHVGRMTGQDGASPWAFIECLARHRARIGLAPIAFVIDSLDEWSGTVNHISAQLSSFLDRASRLSIKVVLASSPRRSQQLRENPQMQRWKILSVPLPLFSDSERAAARRAYFDAYRIGGDLRGRALEMASSPGMMAAIAEAYEGSDAVDEHLTHRVLFDQYRKKKALRIVSRDEAVSEFEIDHAIDGLAALMLSTDEPTMNVSTAMEAGVSGPLLEHLLSESVLIEVGGLLRSKRRLRFRFGRFRDDALAESVFVVDAARVAVERHWASAVGRSAIEYAAAECESVRAAAYAQARSEESANLVGTVDIINGWDLLAADAASGALPPEVLQRLPYMLGKPVLMRSALVREAVRVSARRSMMSMSSGNLDGADRETWTVVAADAATYDELTFRAFLGATTRFLKKEIIWLSEAQAILQLALDRRSEFRGGDHSEFWALVKEVLRLSPAPREARLLLRRVVPVDALCFGTGYEGNVVLRRHYRGIPPNADFNECIRIVQERCSPRAWLAFSFATLLKAFSERIGERYAGKDGTGTGRSGAAYGDNAWLLDTCVPAYREILRAQPVERTAERIRHIPKFSRLHPAFRARALLLAAPIGAIRDALPCLPELRARPGSLPTLADVLDARSPEDPELASQSLAHDLERFGNLSSPEQAVTLHGLIEQGEESAFQAALSIVSQRDFFKRDMFGVEFFAKMSWFAKDHKRALTLILSALNAGYPIGRLTEHESVCSVLAAAIDGGDDLATLRSDPAMSDALAYLLPRTKRFSELAEDFYATSGSIGKRDLLMKPEAASIETAAALLRLAFSDFSATDNIPENDVAESGARMINDLADAAYHAFAVALQLHGQSFFDVANVDVIFPVETTGSKRKVSAGLHVSECLLSYRRDDSPTVHRVLAAWIAIVERFDDHTLNNEVARLLQRWWSLLDDSQKDWYQGRLWNTDNGLASLVNMALFAGASAEERHQASMMIKNASYSVVKSLAGQLWQALDGVVIPPSPQLNRVFDDVIDRTSEPEMASSLMRAAMALARVSADDGLRIVWRLVEKSIHAGLELWPLDLENTVDLGSINLNDLRLAVDGLSNAGLDGRRFVAVQIVCEALAARGEADRAAVREMFGLLAKSDYACVEYRKWQSRMLN